MQKSYSSSIGNTFYQKIGNLFFAAAAVDGNVHETEVDKLKSFVREKWLTLDDIEDEYGTDAAYQIEIIFDWLLENEKTSDECLANFVEFYNDHQDIFTENVIKLILDTANAIAHSFSGKNKAELIFLGRLHLLFYTEETKRNQKKHKKVINKS